MSFFERAKAAASDLAAKADAAMATSGLMPPGTVGGPGGGSPGERALRDLGVLAYLDATGRPVDPTQREQILAALSALEQSGQLGALTVGPPPPPPGAPPPPPGYAAQQASAAAAPPPPPAPPTPAQSPPAASAQVPDQTPPPPPPPPSWAG